jgi:molybdopterin-guanine dinucleotide biosynthesis protein A
MFASVLAGISAAHTNHGPAATSGLFILPIDVPVPRREVWTALAAASDVSVPVSRGVRGHPVFLPWPWILARGLASSGPAGCDQRLDTLIGGSCRTVDLDDPDVVTNLNTPADLEAWRCKQPPEAHEGGA